MSFDVHSNKIDLVEAEMNMLHLKFVRKKEMRKNDEAIYQYDVIGKDNNIARLATLLNKNPDVKSFGY